ncbi:MAG: chromate transporter [Acidobacteria bacterium]|nr:chromate transporter [Acidobacteriota bacterium]MDP7479480.1 chromate efflux transporter [Vicinamibacterales bacterium]HJN45308.1 chromate efflux transporter [Vicinamibacterales bacterium]
MTTRGSLAELARLFLRLGITAFGGPAAHIAMMRDEVVERRHWLTDTEFLDLLAATNLIPGPNSTEMAIHLGYKRGGLPGLLLAGSCFILPACLIVGAIAWGYVRYGDTPQVGWLMYGVSPVIIAIVAHALWKLGKSAVKGPLSALIGALVAGLALAGWNELGLLALGGVVMVGARLGRPGIAAGMLAALGAGGTLFAQGAATIAVPVTLTRLTLFFLKVGSILFGSGYVLLAFLRADLTDRWGWLTDQQLIDAVTVGQVTPGPVFTTATFIGYLLGGWAGATLATIGIFTPGFLFVAISQPLLPRLRDSATTGALLDGVVVASLGLMASVTWHLGRSAIVDVPTVGLTVVAAAILLTLRPNSSWLVLGGGAAGWVLRGGM